MLKVSTIFGVVYYVYLMICNLTLDLHFLGDSDAKVLTLAEHIIAAMPERIKVW